jgi:outer membrane lipoprotein-sorting protein
MDLDENKLARIIARTGGDDAPRPEHREQLWRQVLEVFDRVQAEAARPAFFHHSRVHWRQIMRHPASRVVAAATFVVAIVGVVAWFHGGGATPALADFFAPILDAKTAKYKMTCVERGGTDTAEVMVLAPNRVRVEYEMPNKTKAIQIVDGDKGKILMLNPVRKHATLATFTNQPKERAHGNAIFLELRSQLLDARDRPDFKREPLGEKDIDGRHVVGYRLTGKGMVMDLWGDPKTGLPVRIEGSAPSSPRTKIVYTDFVFNVDLDESLFSLEPPAGYKILNLKLEISPAEEKDLVETLRRYTQLSGGSFPDAFDARAIRHLFRKHWEESHPKANPKTNRKLFEQQWDEQRQAQLDESTKSTHGISFVFDRLPPEADAHYAGKGVALGAAGKPIFWYRPKDAKKYRVIYGDLSVRDADAPPSVPNAQAVPTAGSPTK